MLGKAKRITKKIQVKIDWNLLFRGVMNTLTIAGFTIGLISYCETQNKDLVSFSINEDIIYSGSSGIYSITKGTQVTFRNTSNFLKEVPKEGWVWTVVNSENEIYSSRDPLNFLPHDSVFRELGEYIIRLNYLGNFKVDRIQSIATLRVKDRKPTGNIELEGYTYDIGEPIRLSIKDGDSIHKVLWELDDGITSDSPELLFICGEEGSRDINLTIFNKDDITTNYAKRIKVTNQIIPNQIKELEKFHSTIMAYYRHRDKQRAGNLLEEHFYHSFSIHHAGETWNSIEELIEMLDNYDFSDLKISDIKYAIVQPRTRKIQEIHL